MGPRGKRLTYAGAQPHPYQPAMMLSTLGDESNRENLDPNSEAEGSNMPKKVRGKSCGKNIFKAIAKNGGKKVQILIPDHLARPVENASLLASGVGIVIRRHAPVKDIKSFDDIPPQDKMQLGRALMLKKAWFEFIDIDTDPVVQEKLDDMLRTAFKNWKYRMHVAYNELKDAGRDPNEDCPYNWFEGEVWKAMCDSFEDPSFKRRSEKSKDNRSKQLYPHSSGNQSFHVRYYRMAEEERSLVKNWRDCHTRKNGCMVNDIAESLVEEMESRKKQRFEAGEPVMEEEILAETLGTHTKYRKGMGYGFVPSQPTTRFHFPNAEAFKNAREQFQEQQSQLVQQQMTIEEQSAKIEEQSAKIKEQQFELETLKQKQIIFEEKLEKMFNIFGKF